MKKNLYVLMVTCALSGVAAAPVVAESSLDCLRSNVSIIEPKVIVANSAQYGNRAVVNMEISNTFPWALSDVYMRYVVASADGQTKLVENPIALTIPEGVASGETKTVQTPFFGLPKGSPRQMSVGVSVFDAADPKGDQVVGDIEIIGGDWTGRKSKVSCN